MSKFLSLQVLNSSFGDIHTFLLIFKGEQQAKNLILNIKELYEIFVIKLSKYMKERKAK